MDHMTFLADLFHHRWAVPLLAEFSSSGGGGRVAELAARLEGSRGGIRHALLSLVDLRLVAENPGHGHPLRPEYVLTPRGERVAAEAEEVVELARAWTIQDQAFRKWPLPVLYGLGDEAARFSELRTRIPAITDRALSSALQALTATQVTDRVVRGTRPPRVLYHPTARAKELLPPLRRLTLAA